MVCKKGRYRMRVRDRLWFEFEWQCWRTRTDGTDGTDADIPKPRLSAKNCLQQFNLKPYSSYRVQNPTMLVVGGYLLNHDQLYQLGLRRGLKIENGDAYILNRDFMKRGIKFIYALPVAYPRPTPTFLRSSNVYLPTKIAFKPYFRLQPCLS